MNDCCMASAVQGPTSHEKEQRRPLLVLRKQKDARNRTPGRDPCGLGMTPTGPLVLDRSKVYEIGVFVHTTAHII